MSTVVDIGVPKVSMSEVVRCRRLKQALTPASHLTSWHFPGRGNIHEGHEKGGGERKGQDQVPVNGRSGPGSVYSYKLQHIVGFGLVEMAISTNPKPTICRNLYENTDSDIYRLRGSETFSMKSRHADPSGSVLGQRRKQ